MRNRDIIKQYVNTGNCITEYQYNKLNKNLLKSYTRKRLLNHKNKPFEIYELINLNNDVFKSIASEIGKSLSNEAELTIELTGSTSLEVSGGIKYLILNLGGSTSKGNVIKVSLKTKIGKKST